MSSRFQLNFTPGENFPNLVIVPVTHGTGDFHNASQNVDLIADLDGYFTG